MSNNRIDKWKEPESFSAIFTSPDDEVFELLRRRQAKEENQDNHSSTGISSLNVMRAAKELIFDLTDGGAVFHMILYTINAEKLELEISHILDQVIEGDNLDELKEDVLSTLALAKILDVPVYPNNEEVAPKLAAYHRDMLIEGFNFKTSDGDEKRYKLTSSPGQLVDSFEFIEDLKPTEMYTPAELYLLQKAATTELSKHEEASRVLATLRLAISELSETLTKTNNRDEHELQRCITRNPILFGLEYKRIIPKHSLGSDYEMDYALERSSGIFDLVEIEASNHKLFTKKGDPARPLTHAEQQVLDWLDWIEKHSPYAREKLPGLLNPIGYIIIGRSSTMTKDDRARLRRRNSIMHDTIRIMTYDDLLERAKNLLSVLEGSQGIKLNDA